MANRAPLVLLSTGRAGELPAVDTLLLAMPLPLTGGGTGAASATAALSALGAAPLANPAFTGSLTATGPALINGVLTVNNNIGSGVPSSVSTGSVSFGWNLSGGQGEVNLINNYVSATTAYTWQLRTGTTTALQIMRLASDGTLYLGTAAAQVATQAYVIGLAGSAAPIIDGTAAAGSSTLYARQDHVHPLDTSRAPLASPSFTGSVLIQNLNVANAATGPSPALNDSSANLATTFWVTGQAATVAPLMDSSAAVGTSLLYARQDHVHVSDTSRAPLASPTFSGSTFATTAGSLQFTGSTQLVLGSANTATSTGIEFGSQTTVNQAYVDWHSSGTTADFDFRMSAAGGSATTGQGTMSFTGAAFTYNSSAIATTATVGANVKDYVVSTFQPGVATASARYLVHYLAHPVTLPASLAGSGATALTAFTASTVYTLSYVRAGATTSIATLTFAAAGTVATIGSVVIPTLQSGDLLVLTAPSTADTAGSDVGFSILASKQ